MRLRDTRARVSRHGSLLEITFASDFEGDATDTATGTSDTPDPDGDDLVAELTTPVERIADLRVTKTPSAPTAVAGGELTYTIVLANNGPSSAAEVVLIDEIPAGTTLVSVATEPGDHLRSGRRHPDLPGWDAGAGRLAEPGGDGGPVHGPRPGELANTAQRRITDRRPQSRSHASPRHRCR